MADKFSVNKSSSVLECEVMKTRTERYIEKLCNCIGQLVEIWDSENAAGKAPEKIASKAYFYALVLGIDRKGSVLGGSVDWDRISEFKKSEQLAYESVGNAEGKEFLSRKARMILLRDSARAKGRNLELEYGTRNINFTRADVEKFVKNLDKLLDMAACGKLGDDVKGVGKRVNKLAASFGFVSKYRKFALQAGLVTDNRRQPFCSLDWEDSGGNWTADEELVSNINKWKKKAQKLLDKFQQIEDSLM